MSLGDIIAGVVFGALVIFAIYGYIVVDRRLKAAAEIERAEKEKTQAAAGKKKSR
ncbi:MAG TPA: hypothetical protein GXX51_05325 [Firmicutes bacterium]|nr:hypothetical protein [Bacillota bacterium]